MLGACLCGKILEYALKFILDEIDTSRVASLCQNGDRINGDN